MRMPRRWPWTWWWPMRRPRSEPQKLTEARERLEAITRDDARVERLELRTQKILRENNLAPFVMRALGIRR